jgi:PKD repeat protein
VFRVRSFSSASFDAQVQVTATLAAGFDAQVIVYVSETPPQVSIVTPAATVSGTIIPWSQYFVGQAVPQHGKTIAKASFYFSDFTAPINVSASGNNLYALSTNHVFGQSGIYVVRFSAIDSDGLHNSATRIIHLASGIDPVNITLSGVPDVGAAPLDVRFAQRVESAPLGVSVVANLLNFDDGQATISINPVHSYTEPGIYRPVWVIRDSRGFIFSDTLNVGVLN